MRWACSHPVCILPRGRYGHAKTKYARARRNRMPSTPVEDAEAVVGTRCVNAMGRPRAWQGEAYHKWATMTVTEACLAVCAPEDSPGAKMSGRTARRHSNMLQKSGRLFMVIIAMALASHEYKCSDGLSGIRHWHSLLQSRGRIGEASNPGPPTVHRLDDPEIDIEAEDDNSVPASPVGTTYVDMAQQDRDDTGRDFITATGFAGSKPGYFFTTGPLGLGYYRDGPRTISLSKALGYHAAEHGMATIDTARLHDIGACDWLHWPRGRKCQQIGSTQAGCRNTSKTGAANGNPATAKEKASGECDDQHMWPGTSVEDTSAAPSAKQPRRLGPLSWWPGRHVTSQTRANESFQASLRAGTSPHPLQKGLDAKSTLHVELGLWAFETFNANVWSSLFGYVQRSSADFVLGQETNLFAGDSTSSAEDSLVAKGWRGRIQPCNRGPAGGASAGTVVMARRNIGLAQPLCGVVYDSGRFQLQHAGAVCKGGLHLGSVYLIDRIGPASPLNLAILDKIAEALRLISGRWVLGGDFNATLMNLLPLASSTWCRGGALP